MSSILRLFFITVYNNAILIAPRHEINCVCVMFQMREDDRLKVKTFKIMLDTHKTIVKDLFLLMFPAIGLRNQHGRLKLAILF